MPLLYSSVSFLLLMASLAASQTTHIVQVGAQGSFYTPETLSAQINDTITFVFAGAAHSVTQCAFQSPCVPLPGGFNSGIAGVGSNLSSPAPSWNLIITNVSAPIWFFCESTSPSSHCAAGMVGVINPPSINMYDQFVAAAKLVSGTAAPSPSLTLSGIGAFATNSPAPPTITPPSSNTNTTSTSSFPSSTSTSTSTLSATPSASATDAASTSDSVFEAHKGGIIAGIVVGSIVIIVLLMLLYFFLKRKRDQETIKDFFSYTIPSPKNMTTRSGSQLALPFSSGGGPGAGGGTANALIVPNRRTENEYDFSSGFGRGHAYANVGLKERDTLGSDVSASDDTYASTSTRPSRQREGNRGREGGARPPGRDRDRKDGGDINNLAKEVAAVLQRQTSQTAINTANLPPRDEKPPPDGGTGGVGDVPPPVYRSH